MYAIRSYYVVEPLGETLGLGTRGLAGELVILGGARQVFAHGLERDGDDLIGQRLIERGELVEAQPVDDPAQRRALGEQGEEGEAGGEDADQPLDLERHAKSYNFV